MIILLLWWIDFLTYIYCVINKCDLVNYVNMVIVITSYSFSWKAMVVCKKVTG